MSQPVISISKSLFAGVSAALLVSGAAQAEDTDSVEERIAPVGRVRVEGQAVAPAVAQPAVTEAAAPPAAAADGKAVYQTACFACHGTGAAGAPKLDDKANWVPRIAQGEATLVQHAIGGINAMPPKGGNMSLSDAEVEAAVVYMVNQAQ